MRQHPRALLPGTPGSAAVTSALAQWANSLTDTFAPSVSGRPSERSSRPPKYLLRVQHRHAPNISEPLQHRRPASDCA